MQSGTATMTVSGPFGQFTVEAIVDPDATFSCVAAPALIELGIEPHRVVRMDSDDGSAQFRQLGRALMTVEGQEDIVPVIFGDPGEPSIIGATTLQVLLLQWESKAQRLVPFAVRPGASSQ